MPKSYVLLIALFMLVVPCHSSFGEDTSSANKEILFEVEAPPFTYCLAYSPDGKIIATGGESGIVFWDAATGNRLRSITVDGGTIFALDFSPDGKYLATGGNGGSVNIWHLPDNKIISSYAVYDTIWQLGKCDKPETKYSAVDTEKAEVFAVKFSPNGEKLAAASAETVVVFDDLSASNVRRMDYSAGWNNSISSLSFNQVGTWLAVGRREMVDIWDLKPGTIFQSLDCTGLGRKHSAAVTTVAFNPADDKLFTYGFDHTTAMWDIDTGNTIWMIINSNPITPIIEKDNISGPCNPCHLGFDQMNWYPWIVDAQGLTASFSRDGTLLATGSKNRALTIRDTKTGARVKTYPPFSDSVFRIHAVLFSPDSKTVTVLADKFSATQIIAYNVNYDGGPVAELNNRILNLIDERDTKINLAYINKPVKETAAEVERIKKEYDALIEKEKAAFEVKQKKTVPAAGLEPAPEK